MRAKKLFHLPSLMAIGLGVWTLVGSAWLFPLYSDNNDEAVYLLMADTYKQGRLFAPAPQNWESFLPWMSARSGNVFVTRYTPPFPATVAAVSMVFGSERAALAVIAVVAATTAYLLAYQVLQNRRAATLACTFYCLSPIVLIQSTTYLPYLFNVALLQGFAAILLAGVRSDSRRLLMAAGLLGGIAVFARQFETLLFTLPVLAWAGLAVRRDPRRLLTLITCLGAGALVPVAAMFAYFQATTGNPLSPPYNLTSPLDRFGFGARQMMPGFRVVRYTVEGAFVGMYRLLELMGTWAFGGILLAVLILWAFKTLPKGHPARSMGWILLIVPAGFFFFWGSYGSILWGGPRRLGPYYYMTMAAPLAILGAFAFMQLWARRRTLGAGALCVMVWLSAVAMVGGVKENLRRSEFRRHQYGPLLEANLGKSIVFLPELKGYLMHPFALARNSNFDADVVWALDRGTEANLNVLAEFPGRTAYRGLAYPNLPLSRSYIAHLERLELVQEPQLQVELSLEKLTVPSVRIDLTGGRRTDSFVVESDPLRQGTLRLPLTIGPGSRQIAGPARSLGSRPEDDFEQGLLITAWAPGPPGRPDRKIGEHRLDLSLKPSSPGLQLLLPVALFPRTNTDQFSMKVTTGRAEPSVDVR